jgi:hypothetical protein
VKDGGSSARSARSIAAPPDDRLRTVHGMPLPLKEIVAPFSTLYRLAARFSTIVTHPNAVSISER